MLELQDAEREQEAWFHQSVRTASKPEERHVQWVDSIPEIDEEEDSEDEEDGSEVDEEEFAQLAAPRRIRTPPVDLSSAVFEDEMEYDEDSDDDELSLTRVASKHSPPELTMDDDEDFSDEDDECPSPEEIALELSEKQRQQIATTSFYDIKHNEGIEDYVSSRPQPTLIAAAC